MHSVKKEEQMQIRKRDGSIEAFMPEKVVVSIVKSGAPYKDARSIADSLSNRSDQVMETTDVRDFVHSELKSRGHKSSIENWNRYDTEEKSSRTHTPTHRSESASPHMTHA
jgi:hypothetical protein